MKHSARAPQFVIFSNLKALGVDVRAEVRLPATSAKSRRYFYADLGVYKDGVLVALCECKRRQRALGGRQLENYEGAGIPYTVAADNPRSITRAAEWLRTFV